MTEEMTPKMPPDDLEGTLVQSGEAQARAREASEAKAAAGADATEIRIPGYKLGEELGHGSYATAWRAVQVRTGKSVAVKVFHEASGVNWIQLRREVDRLARLDKHPNVVSLLDADLGHDPPYFVTDLMEGGSLQKHLDPARPVPPAQAARWMDEIAQALAFVHGKGIIHCDLKPANVLLDSEGRVRVADFGQARILNETGAALGTLFYMAPEQALASRGGEGKTEPDVRWDLYALGATVHALLTGRAPYADTMSDKLGSTRTLDERIVMYRELVQQAQRTTAPLTRYGVDEDLAAIVAKCMAHDPDARYAGADGVLADLAARRERRPVSPLARNRAYVVRKFLRRNAVAVAIAAAALAGLSWTGAEILAQRATLRTRYAASLLARGHQLADRMEFAAAAGQFAESLRILPTASARSCLAGCLALLPKHSFSHGSAISSVAFSPDGKRLLTAGGWDRTARLWDLETGEPVGTPMVHDGPIVTALFSPDGSRILTGGGDAVARLWDSATGSPVGSPMAHNAGLIAAVFSADGRMIASSAWDRLVYLWDGTTGAAIGTTGKWGDGVPTLAFSPDGRRLLVGAGDGIARVLTVVPRLADGPTMRLDGVADQGAFSPDGRRVFTSAGYGATRSIRIWDAATGRPAGKPMIHPSPVTRMAVSPDGSRIATACRDNRARIWDARTGALIGTVMEHEFAVLAVAFSPDGVMLATGGEDRGVRIWNPATSRPVAHLGKHEGAITKLAYGAGGRWLAAGGDRTVRVWDLATGGLARGSWSLEGMVTGVVFSPDGRRVMAGTDRGLAEIRDSATGKPVGRPLRPGSGITAVAFSTDGMRAMTADDSGAARVWDASTGEPGPVFRHGKRVVVGGLLAFGDLAITASWDGRIVLWRADSGKVVRELVQPLGVTSIGLGADGARIAAGSWECVLRVWNTETATPVAEAKMPSEVDLVAISPDGRTAAGSVRNNTVQLVDAVTGRPGPVLEHRDTIVAIVFSRNGKKVATASSDQTARIWDVATGAPGPVLRHGTGVNSVVFGPDDRFVATGSWDATVRVWDAETGEPLAPPLCHIDGVGAIALSPDGARLAAGETGGTVKVWDLGWLSDRADDRELLALHDRLSRPRPAGGGIVAGKPAAPAAAEKPAEAPAAARPAAVAPEGVFADYVAGIAGEGYVWGGPPGKGPVFVKEKGRAVFRILDSKGGCGVSLQPAGPEPVNAAGAKVMRVKIMAPKGYLFTVQVNEDGIGTADSKSFAGRDGADGEQYTAYDNPGGGDIYEFVFDLAKLDRNKGYGNQSGNNRVDTQAIKAVDLIVSEGAPAAEIEIYSIRFTRK